MNLWRVSPVFWEVFLDCTYGYDLGLLPACTAVSGPTSVGRAKSRFVVIRQLVEFESVLTHRNADYVFARFLNIQIDLVRFATVFRLGSLFALPVPTSFAFTPLQPLSSRRPRSVDSDVQSVIF